MSSITESTEVPGAVELKVKLAFLYEKRLDANVMNEADQGRLLEDMRKEDYDPISITPMSLYYPPEISDKLHPGVNPKEAYLSLIHI